MIYTSYFAKIKKLPLSVVPIAIVQWKPVWYGGFNYKKLAPSAECLFDWRSHHNTARYIQQYKEEVLDRLDPLVAFDELSELSNGQTFALLCYERPCEFCHRHLVAEWFCSHGYRCEEIDI